MKSILLVLLACPVLSGCVAWEIRDEMRTANSQLNEANCLMVLANQALADVNRDIKLTTARIVELNDNDMRTNAEMAAIYKELQQTNERLVAVNATLALTQPKLTDLDGGLTRMRVLDEMNVTLKEVDKGLAPLSKSMGMLSGAASFLGMGGGESDLLAHENDAPETAPAGDAAAGAPPAPAAPGGAPAAPAKEGAPAGKKPDLMVGTWMLVYPPPEPPKRPSIAFVISADGTYLEAESGKPLRKGKWTRTGRTMTLNLDAGSATKGQPAETTAELITLSSRTLTLRRGDEIFVYARP